MTKFESWGFFAYPVDIWFIDADNLRLKLSATSQSVSVYIECWGYDEFQLFSLILKSPVIIRILFKFISGSFRYLKAVC